MKNINNIIKAGGQAKDHFSTFVPLNPVCPKVFKKGESR